MRAATYQRVSTRDGRQTTENQELILRKLVKDAGWTLEREYRDEESGARADRPAFLQMLEDAGRRRFDVLVFYSLDRLSREGVLKTLQILTRLSELGIQYRSYTEPYLDTCGMFKDAVVAILATIATQERKRLSERITAGIERAKAQGKPIGRRKAPVNLETFAKASATLNNQELQELFGISRSKVFELLAEVRRKSTEADELHNSSL